MGVYEFLNRKRIEWEDKLLIHQKKTFFSWMENVGIEEGEKVIFALFEENESYSFIGRKWKKVSGVSDSRFILCKAEQFASVISQEEKTRWQRIFFSQVLEVWERESYYKDQVRSLPLRLGITNFEKKIITKEVRRMIGEVLEGKEPHASSQISARFDQRQDLDVALWVDGKIRASVIMIGKSCREALEIGAWRATRDNRFVPITLEELPQARIEITLMSDLVIPLTLEEYKRNEIDPTKGYRVSLNDKSGWYLPEVHNAVSFHHLQNFLSRLSKEKAKIQGVVPLHSYGQFELIDWIESEEDILNLYGPAPARKEEEVSQKEVREVADKAVEWLKHIQRPDGSLPHIISQKGESGAGGFAALGCVGHATAVYGKVSGNQTAPEVSQKIYSFLQYSLPRTSEVSTLQAWIYYLRLSLVLGEEIDTRDIEYVLSGKDFFEKNPIYCLQALSLLCDYEKTGKKDFADFLREEGKRAYQLFEKRKDLSEIQLAFYPELLAVFSALWNLTGDVYWKERALNMSEWYKGKQQKDGSFPHSPNRTFSYTRGTGKIFEVLACFPEENKSALTSSFQWLRSMQYDSENLFWVDKQKHAQFIGGFRHDAFRREAWIDGAAHVILGCARWLK